MKKFASMLLGLSLILGTASVTFGQDKMEKKEEKKDKKKKKKMDGEKKPF